MEVNVAIIDHSVAVGLRQLLHRGAQQAAQQEQPVLVSITERTWMLDPIDLFEHAQDATADRFYWSQPDEGFTFVGLGIARAFDAVEESRFRQIGTSWRHLMDGAILEGPRGLPGVGPLLFGGFSFDTERLSTPLWDGYPAGRMVLPKVVYTIRDDAAWLTCNVLVEAGADPDAEELAAIALSEELLTLHV